MTEMTIATPNNIDVLLHYFRGSNEPHPRLEAPAVQEALDLFVQCGALERVNGSENYGIYRVTPMGKAWVSALCLTEIPQRAFVDAHGRVLDGEN